MNQRIFFTVLFFFTCINLSHAQQNRFVYIQTENKQPFFVKMNNTVFNSSSNGYLIIPKLKEGSYQALIGFPKNEWSQQSVVVTINKKDVGLALKNFGERGWGLQNLQTQEVNIAKSEATLPVQSALLDDDPFIKILSDVVNTPDLRKKSTTQEVIVKAEPKKEEPVVVKTEIKKEEPKKEESIVVKTEIKKEEPVVEQVNEKTELKNEPPKEKPEAKIITETNIEKEKTVKGKLNLVYNKSNSKGREMIYVVDSDTVRIFIPAKKPVIAESKNKTKPKEKTKEKFLDIELPVVSKDSIITIPANESGVADNKSKSPVIMINSDCRGNASQDDFGKLKKKMAANKSIDDMVSTAKKSFKLKCYSTENIKELGTLFLNDEGRYKFFDTAYPFVYDTGNFSQLEGSLTDPYFITRFQAMIRK
ncbi:MAG: DUF4476 domain-containing protein [Ferruginibacter sp.]